MRGSRIFGSCQNRDLEGSKMAQTLIQFHVRRVFLRPLNAIPLFIDSG